MNEDATAPDPAPGLLHAVTLAIGDPGSAASRGDSESLPDWKARAVLEAVRPFLMDDSDRPHAEEARRILAAFGKGELSVPASYGTPRALYGAGRTLLGLLDKIAPKGEADGG